MYMTGLGKGRLPSAQTLLVVTNMKFGANEISVTFIIKLNVGTTWPSAKCQNRIRVFAGFHQFPSFLKLGNPETTKPIATVSSLSVLFSRDIDSFPGFHKFHRFPYLVLPEVS